MKKKFLLIPYILLINPLSIVACSKTTNQDNDQIEISFNKQEKYFVNYKNKISAILNVPNKSYYFDWNFSNENIVIENNGNSEIEFYSSIALQNVVIKLTIFDDYNKNKIISKNETIISIENEDTINPPLPETTYTVSINLDKPSYKLNEIANLEAIVLSSSGDIINDNNLHYQWTIEPNLNINNNGNKNIKIELIQEGDFLVKLRVFRNYDLENELCSSEIKISVLDSNYKYGLKIDGVDKYTQRSFSNQSISFEKAIENANNEFKQKIEEEKIQEYLNDYILRYSNSFITQRRGALSSEIEENNVKLNENKTISGNIKIKFICTNDITTMNGNGNMQAGDIEYHNFVFDNSSIEAYVNTTITNFISFKIQTKYLQKQRIGNDESKNFNIGLKNETIYLDQINEITLQINNSLFSIIPEKLIENMYLYSISTEDEKSVIEETISSLLTQNAKLLVTGKDPMRENLNILNSVIEIDLKKNYIVSNSFESNFSWVLGSLFNFVYTKASIKIINDKLYISSGVVFFWINNSSLGNGDKVIDLSKDENTIYEGQYREYRSLNIFPDEALIKQKIIENNKDKIKSESWFDYLENLSDEEKANKIYEFYLNLVSYGQISPIGTAISASSISGIISGKIICEGYANLFSYLANILWISSITITGNVGSNSDPNNGLDGLHAWNLLKVNNQWYWFDPTWDDGMSAGSTIYKKDYFMKNTETFFGPKEHVDVTNWSNGKDLPIKIPEIKV